MASRSENSVTGGFDAQDEQVVPREVVVADEEEEHRIRRRAGKRAVRSGGSGGDETDGEQGDRRRKRSRVLDYLDVEAEVDDDDEEDEEEGEEDGGFINEGADLGYEPNQMMPRQAFIAEDETDIDEMERQVRQRYNRPSRLHYVDDRNDVEQQALFPTIGGPKFYLVKCKIGHEREIAIRLMQRFVQRKYLRILSVVALDHLQNYIYVEAMKLVDVKEAIVGLQNVYISHEPEAVPEEEMTSVLSVENKIIDVAKGSWVRMRRGEYQGDLAQVVDVNNAAQQEVTVKLIPRIDLRYLAEKSASKARNVVLKRNSVPPPRFFKKEEIRKYKNLKIFKKRDRHLGDGFVQLEAPSLPPMMFKDGFLYKTVSRKSISTSHVEPTFEDMEKFQGPYQGDTRENIDNLSTMVANRRRGYFMKGDAVVVIRGDLKNLEGWVRKVESDIVHIKPKMTGLSEKLTFMDSELCKLFKLGEKIKVVYGVLKGASGTVVKVDGHVLTVLSDTTKEHIHIFADHATQSTEFTKPLAQIGGYELYDLVQLNDKSFGVITRLESEGLKVLQGVPDRPEVRIVRLAEIKNKIYRNFNAKDRLNNIISPEDIIRVIEGPLKGKQGTVKYILKGILFIHNPHHVEHAGFICTRAQSCLLVGGATNRNIGHVLGSQSGAPSTSSSSQFRRSPLGVASSQFPGWNFGGRDRGQENNLVGKFVKIKSGPYKGYNGQVIGSKGNTIRVELESLMKTMNFSRDQILDVIGTPALVPRDTRSLPGATTPFRLSQTPLHPMQTRLQDVDAIATPALVPRPRDTRSLPYARTPIRLSQTPLHPMQTPTQDVRASLMRGGVRTATLGLDGSRNRR